MSESKTVFHVFTGVVTWVMSYICIRGLAVCLLYMYEDVFMTGKILFSLRIFTLTGAVIQGMYYFLPYLSGWWRTDGKGRGAGFRNRVDLPALLLHLAVADCFLWVYIKQQQSLGRGLFMLANRVIEKWNDYYGSHYAHFYVSQGKPADVKLAFLFLLLLVFWWVTVSVLWWKDGAFAVIPGLLMAALCLLVGYVPGKRALFLLMAGGICVLPLCRWRDPDKKIRTPLSAAQGAGVMILAAAVSVSAGTVWRFGGGLADELAAGHEEVIAWQKNLEEQILEKGSEIFSEQSPGTVSGRTPRYREKEVMTVTMSGRPDADVYLRGYVGDTYRGGIWENEGAAEFARETAERPGRWGEEAGKRVLNLAYETEYRFSGRGTVAYELRYPADADDYAYLPCGIRYDSIKTAEGPGAGVAAEGDAYFLRGGCRQVTAEGAAGNALLENLPYSEQDGGAAAQQLCGLYEESVSRYLAVPEELEDIRGLGRELAGVADMFSDTLTLEESDLLHSQRERAAVKLVRDVIFSRTEYSLKPDPVPQGEDVTEYFLFGQGKGFCQHYASAAALLLRTLGIPARYVTGYLAPADTFVRREDGSYEAVVRDSTAHAWVEVYVAGRGWFPAEVTKGRATEAGPAENSGVGNVTAGAVRAWDSTEEVQDHTDNGSDSQENKNEGNPAKTEPEKTKRGTEGRVEAGSSVISSGMVFCGAAFLCFLAGLAGGYIPAEAARKPYRLYEQGRYREAVLAVSGRVYLLLKRKGAVQERAPDDAGFRELVREYFPEGGQDLEQYFNIAERAAYDCSAVSREQAAHCLSVLEKMRPRGFVHSGKQVNRK